VGVATLAPAVVCLQQTLAISQPTFSRNFGILDSCFMAEHAITRDLRTHRMSVEQVR
jgi:hypothetical protein